MREILSIMRRAIIDFKMIESGDKIAVGLSGGKDSLTLLKALALYKKFSPEKFELCAITVDPTGGKADYSLIKKFCEELEVEYIIAPSDIFEVIFDIRKEKSPCSLCAKLRRGALNETAVRSGCNKVALGHTADDLIETFFLSMFYEGRLSTFAPVTYLDRKNVTVIRPFIHLWEKYTKKAANDLPVYHNTCPVNHHTQRENVKNKLKELQKEMPLAKERVLSAIINPDRYNLFKPTNTD